MKVRRGLLLTLLLAMCACGAKVGTFASEEFRFSTGGFSAPYADPARKTLISREWHVDNYYYEDGVPTEAKTEGQYVVRKSWDQEPKDPFFKTTYCPYELKLSNRASNGVIWVRKLLLPPEYRRKHIDVLLRNLVDNLNGSAYDVELDSPVQERRIATKLLSQRPARVAGLAAYEVEFDLVSLDQLELDPNAPRTRVRLLLVRRRIQVPMHEPPGQTYPGLFLIGYGNDAAAFEDYLDDFVQFVSGIAFTPTKE